MAMASSTIVFQGGSIGERWKFLSNRRRTSIIPMPMLMPKSEMSGNLHCLVAVWYAHIWANKMCSGCVAGNNF